MEFETLLKASDSAIKGVSWKSSTQTYYLKRLVWTSNTYKKLKDKTYKTKGYKEFTIHERGKLRLIRSNHISDRVVQKAFNQQVLKPKIYPKLIYDNGASREGMGTDFALKRMKVHLQKHYRQYGNNGYVLLLDFSNYFGNIDKEILLHKLSKVLMEEELYFMKVFLSQDHQGLGLGSEVNQTCAIFYANDVDHFIKEKLHIKYYGRYMDDSYLIHPSKKYLERCLVWIREVCKRDGIILNERKCKIVNIKSDNIRFLKKQIRITDGGKIIVRPIKENYTRRTRILKNQSALLNKGVITQRDIDLSYSTWRGFVAKYNAPYYIIKQEDELYRLCREGLYMTDEQIVKSIKQLQENLNDLTQRVESLLLQKHNENSEAIDDIVITMLGGDSSEG